MPVFMDLVLSEDINWFTAKMDQGPVVTELWAIKFYGPVRPQIPGNPS